MQFPEFLLLGSSVSSGMSSFVHIWNLEKATGRDSGQTIHRGREETIKEVKYKVG